MTKKDSAALPSNPFEDDLLTETFYQPRKKRVIRKNDIKAKRDKKKPQHYKVCCISLYTEDIERLDEMVKDLKKRGYTKANKSQVIRYALANVDISKMPKPY